MELHLPGRHLRHRHHRPGARSGDEALRWASVILYGLLLAAWIIVAVRTARGSATGRLFRTADQPKKVSASA